MTQNALHAATATLKERAVAALNQAKEHRKAWLYNPGQRRVRRAPNVAFDNPGTAADGLRTPQHGVVMSQSDADHLCDG